MSNHLLSQLVDQKKIIITIDGTAASGKNTLGAKLQTKLKINYLDSGQIYRLFIWFYCQNPTWKIKTIVEQFQKNITFQKQQIYFQNKAIDTIKIHDQKMDSKIIDFVYQKWVRNSVNQVCQKIVKTKSFIITGRDANTNIFPESNYKFFLTASLQTRARRKYHFWQKQPNCQSIPDSNLLKQIKAQILQRDQQDAVFQLQTCQQINDQTSSNSLSKWQKMQLDQGAIVVDNTHLTVDETVNKISKIIAQRWTNLEEVVIVGATNVGKSTLFNALSPKSKVLVSDYANTTRDLYQSQITTANHSFFLVDTGGIFGAENDSFQQIITQKTKKAILQAKCLLWVVDHHHWNNPINTKIKRLIKKKMHQTILVVNKIDQKQTIDKQKWLQVTGIKDQIAVSAKWKKNLASLQRMILTKLKSQPPLPKPKTSINVGLLGKTNVGKSSIFNALFDENIALVFAKPHTTTNVVEKTYFYQDYQINFIDSAGMRRRRKKMLSIEEKAVHQIQTLLPKIDVVALVCDGTDQFSVQEKRIAGLVIKSQKPFFVLVNKTEFFKKKERKETVERVKNFIPQVRKAKRPVFLVSANHKSVQKRTVLKTIINLVSKDKK